MATHKEVSYSGFIFSITKATDEESDEPINIVNFHHKGEPRGLSLSYREPVFENRNAAFEDFNEASCKGILSIFGIKDTSQENKDDNN